MPLGALSARLRHPAAYTLAKAGMRVGPGGEVAARPLPPGSGQGAARVPPSMAAKGMAEVDRFRMGGPVASAISTS
jgi:hypothetical protein